MGLIFNHGVKEMDARRFLTDNGLSELTKIVVEDNKVRLMSR